MICELRILEPKHCIIKKKTFLVNLILKKLLFKTNTCRQQAILAIDGSESDHSPCISMKFTGYVVGGWVGVCGTVGVSMIYRKSHLFYLFVFDSSILSSAK